MHSALLFTVAPIILWWARMLKQERTPYPLLVHRVQPGGSVSVEYCPMHRG